VRVLLVDGTVVFVPKTNHAIDQEDPHVGLLLTVSLEVPDMDAHDRDGAATHPTTLGRKIARAWQSEAGVKCAGVARVVGALARARMPPGSWV